MLRIGLSFLLVLLVLQRGLPVPGESVDAAAEEQPAEQDRLRPASNCSCCGDSTCVSGGCCCHPAKPGTGEAEPKGARLGCNCRSGGIGMFWEPPLSLPPMASGAEPYASALCVLPALTAEASIPFSPDPPPPRPGC